LISVRLPAEENFGDLTVDMGAGNDTLDLGAVADTDTGSSIKGGAGDGDILIISGACYYSWSCYSNF
jgi:hypothetical protein